MKTVGYVLALFGAIFANAIGYVFTGWLLVRPGGPHLGDYAAFAGACAVVALIGAAPGLLIALFAHISQVPKPSPEPSEDEATVSD